MRVDIELQGARELGRELYRLESKVRISLMEEAMTEAGEIIRQEAHNRAPRQRGGLAKSLAVQIGRKHSPSVRIGPGRGGAHGNLVELGTGARQTKYGDSRGTMPAQPFLKPALEAKENEALAKFREVLRKGLGL